MYEVFLVCIGLKSKKQEGLLSQLLNMEWDSDVKKGTVIFLDTFTGTPYCFVSKFLVLNLTHNDT